MMIISELKYHKIDVKIKSEHMSTNCQEIAIFWKDINNNISTLAHSVNTLAPKNSFRSMKVPDAA